MAASNKRSDHQLSFAFTPNYIVADETQNLACWSKISHI
jgi:hypothetical protein